MLQVRLNFDYELEINKNLAGDYIEKKKKQKKLTGFCHVLECLAFSVNYSFRIINFLVLQIKMKLVPANFDILNISTKVNWLLKKKVVK